MNDRIVEPCAIRIKKALSERKMTQTELCARANISKSSLSEYLSGKHEPGQYKIFILAKALDVDPVWLWGYDVPMESKTEVPGEPQLTGVDKELWEMLKRIPEDQKRRFLQLGRVFEDTLNKE